MTIELCSKVDYYDATFIGVGVTLNDTTDDGAFVACVLAKSLIGFGFAEAPHDSFANGLGTDTGEVDGGVVFFRACYAVFIEFLHHDGDVTSVFVDDHAGARSLGVVAVFEVGLEQCSGDSVEKLSYRDAAFLLNCF